MIKSNGYRTVIEENDPTDARRWPFNQRFVPISDRRDESVISASTWKHFAVDSAYHQTWKSTILNKGPVEIATYPILLNELRPRTILELGALHGGGAIWMADICEALHVEAQIISLDIDLSLLSDEARMDPRISFVQGDVSHIGSVPELSNFRAAPHPWLVIDDCHYNTGGILDFVSSCGAVIGDYIIIEDTNLDAWDAWSHRWMDTSRVENGKGKIKRMREWLGTHDEWLVDLKYVDFFGYNASKNWNSVLRKMRE